MARGSGEPTGSAAADLLDEAASAIGEALGSLDDWGLAGTRAGQHHSDLAADAAALKVLERAGAGVLSEESGLRGEDRPLLVVVDPLDGSTNAAHGIPWFATALCAVDADGPVAALVVNLVSGDRFAARRGAGATLNGERISPSRCGMLADAVIGLSGFPPRWLGWRQYRALGAVALDLCAVASGMLDGYIDCSPNAHGVWDYLGATLICQEAGASVVDAFSRELVLRSATEKRTPVAAATPALLGQLVEARASF